MRDRQTFDKVSMRATERDCYGLPWPCWGNKERCPPGSPVFYVASKLVMKGGRTFRARFGNGRGGMATMGRRPVVFSKALDQRAQAGWPFAAQRAGTFRHC